MAKRLLTLPDHGTLLVSTDLHGNLEDFERLRAVFNEAVAADAGETFWVLLGDAVHGPDDAMRDADPALYGYQDRSWEVVRGIVELRQAWPHNVVYVLGNHDHAHVGGPPTRRGGVDEAARLDGALTRSQRETMTGLFGEALLAVVARCGVALCHGSPGDALRRAEDLDEVSLDGSGNDAYRSELLRSLLNDYGQEGATTDAFLHTLSSAAVAPLRLLIHGHDRDPAGWFTTGPNQLCPVLFGAPRHAKRYVRLDLSRRYESAGDVRDGVELRRLYPEPGAPAAAREGKTHGAD